MWNGEEEVIEKPFTKSGTRLQKRWNEFKIISAIILFEFVVAIIIIHTA